MVTDLHVAYIVSHYPHKAFGHDGGLGTSVYNLVEKLRTSGVQVSVFVYGQKQEFILEEENVTMYSLSDSTAKFLKFYFNRKKIEKFINHKIKEKNIAIIEAPDWTGITAFMNFKIPLIIRFHGSDAYFCHLENRKQKRKNFWFEKLAIKGAQAYIAPTSFAGEVSKELFSIKNKEIQTIHYGLELKNFTNDSPLVYDKGMILYVGTLIRKKGVLELPEIFNKVRKEFPQAKLVLIGSDASDIKTDSNSTWQLMQNQFKNNDVQHVEYLGKIPYNQVQNYIKKANVCVFPTFAETLGMVTIESMAMQKAVVNSNIGWAKELIIDEESGFLVHPANHNLYAERIIELLKDDSFCLKIGQQSRTRVETKFDINKVVFENIAFYKQIINQKN
ncbi:glycosyltransferase involved in cell wall biosynthesis [Flavobacterium chryseum]|uniref:glycosyltransferase family 4 protein n=1 Tax=Flavobacterium sp. P3160 TaxID=2512113 RepID=UPI0010DE5534|nr:glycosyltransferase family 4 protein [Flavobacterium sp. P3160]TDO77478.1 glycosyltransferase involved in cell wall biosynthesis [Flavobacterium sp. P3160]